jgi:curli production assembly/transport component CsgE
MLRLFPLASLLIKALVATAFAAWTLVACADPGPEQPNRRDRKVSSETYGGVVVNQTITVAGQNFYQCFVAFWRDREMSDRYAISIHERPSARWGTQVWIEYAQKRVFQAFLPSSIANIKALSEQAAEVAQQKVADVEVDRLLFREAEFGPDEI